MKCYQCSTPAMYQVGKQDIPLCLDCYFKFSQISQQQTENHERMLNYLSDDIAASVGMPPMGPRFPERPKSVIVAGARLDNISVNNSTVGTINTGSIGTIDQAITVLGQVGSSAQAEAVKHLSEAILKSGDLSRTQKNELVEILSVLAKEAAVPADARRGAMAKTLIERAASITSLANDVTDVCAKWWPVILAAFGTLSGVQPLH